jgi:hypothetical protein
MDLKIPSIKVPPQRRRQILRTWLLRLVTGSSHPLTREVDSATGAIAWKFRGLPRRR